MQVNQGLRDPPVWFCHGVMADTFFNPFLQNRKNGKTRLRVRDESHMSHLKLENQAQNAGAGENPVFSPKSENKMRKFRVYEWVWDMKNGEYHHRDFYGIEVVAKDEDDLIDKLEKWLEEDAKEWEKQGYVCEIDSGDSISMICAILDEACVKETKEELGEELAEWEIYESCTYEYQVGYDWEEVAEA